MVEMYGTINFMRRLKRRVANALRNSLFGTSVFLSTCLISLCIPAGIVIPCEITNKSIEETPLTNAPPGNIAVSDVNSTFVVDDTKVNEKTPETAEKNESGYTDFIDAGEEKENDYVSEQEVIPQTQTDDFVDFDELYPSADASWGYYASDCQPYIDADYITYFAGDYYHHNTNAFMSYFWKLKPGTKVKISGRVFTCGGIEYASSDMYNIVTESGIGVFDNDTVEIITCSGSSNDSGRYVAFLY